MLLAAALASSPLAAGGAAAPAERPYAIERSAVTQVTAPDGHVYRIFLSWPEGSPPSGGWPVLYLLDGADHFATATEAARRLARAGARSGIAPGIVVGVDSGPLARRVLDYTPAAPGYAIPSGAPASGLATGGADAFLTLIEQRVKPLVAARWQIDPARQTIAGHSFGGLLALHALFTRPDIATRHAAISPSLWFGGDLLAREQRRAQVAGRAILLAVGTEEGGPNADAGAAAEALATRLTEAGATARFTALDGQNHGTTMLAAMGQVIALAFGKAP